MSKEVTVSSCPAYAVVDASLKEKEVSKNDEQSISGDVALYDVVNTLEEEKFRKILKKTTNSMHTESKFNLYMLVLSLAIVVLLIALIICTALSFTRMTKMNLDLEHVQEVAALIVASISESEVALKAAIEHLHNDSFTSMMTLINEVTDINSELTYKFSNLNVSFIELNSQFERIGALLNATVSGSCSSPAPSCEAIYQTQAVPTSGYYWLRSANGSSVEVYCEMTRTCGGRGGRMRVVQLNNSTRREICTDKLKVLTNTSRCGLRDDNHGDCSCNIFNVMNIQYSHICGTVEGYGLISVDGFYGFGRNTQLSITDNYVDGISLTLDNPNTPHVWTFVALTTGRRAASCLSRSPSFVDDDYSCLPFINGTGAITTCQDVRCSQNFNRTLDQPTSDNIEMRLCRDQGRRDEDIVVGNIEIYVW